MDNFQKIFNEVIKRTHNISTVESLEDDSTEILSKHDMSCFSSIGERSVILYTSNSGCNDINGALRYTIDTNRVLQYRCGSMLPTSAVS